MAGEQASLKTQFPNVIKVLTTGKRNDADPDPFPPVKNLHVGVVSSDMGIPGVEFPSGNCHADGGDDGRLQSTPRSDPATGLTCDGSYPTFLAYDAAHDDHRWFALPSLSPDGSDKLARAFQRFITRWSPERQKQLEAFARKKGWDMAMELKYGGGALDDDEVSEWQEIVNGRLDQLMRQARAEIEQGAG